MLRLAVPGMGDLRQRDASGWADDRTLDQVDVLDSRLEQMRADSLGKLGKLARGGRNSAPDITAQREPQLPVEYGVYSVSPCTSLILLISMPRISCATCGRVVSILWPCE